MTNTATNRGRRIDSRGIIKHFGGRSQLHRTLRANGINVSIKTVEAWGARGTIPTKRLADLIAIGKTIGKPLDISEFFFVEGGEA